MKRERKQMNVKTIPCHVFGGVNPKTGQPARLHNWKASRRQCTQCGRTRRQVRAKRARGQVVVS
jgi:hypothetical protein